MLVEKTPDWEKLKTLQPEKAQPLHPYFTSQPVNIVREYVKLFTHERETILDPFCGSGITGIAASTENRKAILFDLSPFAVLICNSTFSEIRIKKTIEEYQKIKNDLEKKINDSYSTELSIKRFVYPNIVLPKSSDAKNIYELFTKRNLYNLTILRNRINDINDIKIRNFMKFVFSGILHRASRTYFYDKAKWGGGNSSIFTKYRYWIPPKPDERNVWELFEIRFKRILKIKQRLQEQLKSKVTVYSDSATKLNRIPNNSIDYVYTDPPYGANIAYLDLSTMWTAWLDLRQANTFEEAIEGGSQEHSREHYLEIMKKSFREIYRVLKPGKFFSLVFQHKDLNLWYDLIELCQEQNFEYVNTFSYGSYYKTFHKNTNTSNVISGQLIINFKKNGKNKFQLPKNGKTITSIIDPIIKTLEKNNQATTENIVNLLIPQMLEQGINPRNFDLLNHLRQNYSFGNDEKWKSKTTISRNLSDNTTYTSIVIDLDFPNDYSEQEVKEKIKGIFDLALKTLRENGVLWVITTDIRNNLKFVPVSLIVLEEAAKNKFYNYNSIVWLNEDNTGNGIFSNTYTNIEMFAKNPNYFFNKDPIREKHIWKDIEWGKRKFRYNEKGKDPGNVWIKNFDDRKGKIINQEYYTKKEIIERLFSITDYNNTNNLLITNKSGLGGNYKILPIKLRKSNYKNELIELKSPSKTQNLESEIKIFFKSSEQMKEVEDNSIKLIITSPPYWNLKDYKKTEQIGFREDYDTFNKRLTTVWKECFRVLDVDGTMWINVNSRIVQDLVYLLHKDITDIVKEIGFKLIDILIWHKSSGIPVSGKRLKDNFEYVLIFAKNLPTLRFKTDSVFFDYLTNSKQNRCSNVWNLNRYTGSIGKKFIHPAIYPDELVERAIELCTAQGQYVLDPFLGSGTTALACAALNRKCVSYEINKNYKKLIEYRIRNKIGDIEYYSKNIHFFD